MKVIEERYDESTEAGVQSIIEKYVARMDHLIRRMMVQERILFPLELPAIDELLARINYNGEIALEDCLGAFEAEVLAFLMELVPSADIDWEVKDYKDRLLSDLQLSLSDLEQELDAHSSDMRAAMVAQIIAEGKEIP